MVTNLIRYKLVHKQEKIEKKKSPKMEIDKQNIDIRTCYKC